MGKKKHVHVVVIHADANEGECTFCGKAADLRPYGPNGEFICFDCGMKDEETTMRQCQKAFAKILDKEV